MALKPHNNQKFNGLLNYNTAERKPYMGSAIFFHVWSLENNGIFHIEGTEYQ